MIDDKGVARVDPAPENPADFIDLRRQRANMERLGHPLRHHAPAPVENGEGEVLAFLDDGGITGPQHVQGEFAGDLQRGLVDHFKVNGDQCVSPRGCGPCVGPVV